MTDAEKRKAAIEKYTRGKSPAEIYTSLGRTKQWFYKWLKRYLESGVDGLKERSRRPKRSPRQIPSDIEKRIAGVRRHLAGRSSKETQWAPVGADSIGWHLEYLYPGEQHPSRATINRVIQRNGLLTERKKTAKGSNIPYPAPLADHPNAVHQMDTVGPRFISGSKGVEQFYSIHLSDCYSRVVAMRQYEDAKGSSLIEFLLEAVWSSVGIPKVLQVDNVLSVKGSNRHPRSLGAVISLCLLFGVEVLFIPTREPQRNGIVESFNNQFDKAFFRSTTFQNLEHLQCKSAEFERYYCEKRPHTGLLKKKHGSRIPKEAHSMHQLRMLPAGFKLDEYMVKGKLKIPLHPGKVSFIRWVNKTCSIPLFSEQFKVDESLKYNYVTATIFTSEHVLRFTHNGQVVNEIPYKLNP
ncbi:MAG: integrase core domain-containing protein [Bacillota bacterium]|nr:integrase core domain-containing protein [Bacillota bacterium]